MIDPTRDTAEQLRDLVDGIESHNPNDGLYGKQEAIAAIDRLAALGLLTHWRVITDDPATWPEPGQKVLAVGVFGVMHLVERDNGDPPYFWSDENESWYLPAFAAWMPRPRWEEPTT